ncbi:MAG: PAS domain S-box protein [Candidatus Accumulibacter sp.]|nr:PAS domain S-box protein [Accumulibacter sp.]
MGIRQGLRLFTLLGGITLSGIVALAMWGSWRGQESLRHVLEAEVVPTQQLFLVDQQLTRLRVRMYGVLADDFGIAGARLHLAQARQDIALGWATYREAHAATAGEEEQNLTETVETVLRELPGLLDRLDGLLAARDLQALAAFVKEDWWTLQLQLATPVRQLIALQQGRVADAYAAAQTLHRQALIGGGVLFAVGLALLLVFSRLLLRYVSYKLDVIEHALLRMGSGDLRTRVGGSSRGEFGRIIVALDRTADRLREDREAIELLQRQQQSILESVADGLYGTDASGLITYANTAAQRLLGWSAAEILGKRAHPMFHHTRADGSPYPAAECPLSGARLRAADFSGSTDEVFWRKDGSSFPVEFSGAPIIADEQLVGTVISFRDISDRHAADAALRKALEQAQEYLDVTLAVMVVIDRELCVRMINRAGCELLGLSEAEIVGSNWFERFVPAAQSESLARSFMCWLDEKQAGVIAAHNQNDILTAGDQVRRVSWSNALLRDAFGAVIGNLSSGLDVSEQHAAELQLHDTVERLTELNRKLEEAQNQLLQSEKMASIGQLAAGVAHEINNPVGFVNSNLGSLRNEVGDLLRVIDAYALADPILAGHPAVMDAISKARDAADLDYLRADVGTLIDESLEGLQRVRRIVQDLKDFSRVDSSEWEFANLEAGLDSTLNIVWNEIKYKAEVHKEYAGVPAVECIAAQVNQVLLNLLVNAAHAIENRGTITLRTGCDAREVWIEVEDSGQGIAPANLKRIFEPFFTTKPVGEGTGLGLSLAYSIAQRHGGRIEASSELGVGSKFRLVLPTTRAPAEAEMTGAGVAGSDTAHDVGSEQGNTG